MNTIFTLRKFALGWCTQVMGKNELMQVQGDEMLLLAIVEKAERDGKTKQNKDHMSI